jgi:hypothetical protein
MTLLTKLVLSGVAAIALAAGSCLAAADPADTRALVEKIVAGKSDIKEVKLDE